MRGLAYGLAGVLWAALAVQQRLVPKADGCVKLAHWIPNRHPEFGQITKKSQVSGRCGKAGGEGRID